MMNKKHLFLAAIAVLALFLATASAEPALRSWSGTPPPKAPGITVSAGEVIITDPPNDQYKYYRPDWNWPITSDLDVLEARLYSDGQYLYLRFKFQTLKNKYSPYVMVVMDFTPDNPNDGFDYWLPDWSDTKLPWKWDAIVGVNLGKYETQPFVFDHSWNPKPVGQLEVDQQNAVIEAKVPVSELPGFPLNGKVKVVILVFANDYGGIWDPGKKKAYDPEVGVWIDDSFFYASNVYDIAGQTPTYAEVYGGWSNGVQEVAVYYTVTTSQGTFTSTTLGRKVSYARSLVPMKLIYPPLPGSLRAWSGKPLPPAPGYGVVDNEAVLTDPAGDQYKYYRPDWNWPITSDLDVLEARLYSDGQYLYLRFKLSQLSNEYSPYIMVVMDFTPDNPNDGFNDWLPDWSDTKLPWKWDAIVGVNLGKYETQPFVFDHSWNPKPVGQLAINKSQGVIEAKVPLSALPGFPSNGKIKYTIVVFANSFGGIWDPGENKAVDPSTGKTITNNDYASDVYDIAGQAPTSAEVYGNQDTVKTAFVASTSGGLFVGVSPA
ncbi:hypothetical protein [Thermofilum pendens]|uniref:Uncharacterized protein n=1 Tax=Thermofilum pendens (strain DSM 2475 / Hrk 5) TaxID=368408 RepID=A1RYQ4_THEPD|nr:hypothetical protein [Thermofilum pendens]ABL78334.1 hypothetical protein Tpen_0933 [Thermofilum pendens Hrk 5]